MRKNARGMLRSRVLRRFERWIPAYLNGMLPDRRRRWFERRVAESEACRSELRSYQRLDEVLHAAPPRYPSADRWTDFGCRLREQLRSDGGAEQPSAPGLRRELAGMLAYALGGAVVGLMLATAAMYGASRAWRSGYALSVGLESEQAALELAGVDASEAADGRFEMATLGDDGLGGVASARDGDVKARVPARGVGASEPVYDALPEPAAPIDLYQDGMLLVASAHVATRSR